MRTNSWSGVNHDQPTTRWHRPRFMGYPHYPHPMRTNNGGGFSPRQTGGAQRRQTGVASATTNQQPRREAPLTGGGFSLRPIKTTKIPDQKDTRTQKLRITDLGLEND